MFATPGIIVNNSVKLRPFKGRSFICAGETTVPSSEVENSSAGAAAVTVTVLVAAPTFS